MSDAGTIGTTTRGRDPAAHARAICDFCQLPVPGGAARGGEPPHLPEYCCYGCRLAAEITRQRGTAGQMNWMLTRLGIAIFLSMAVMMFSMFGYRQRLGGGSGAPPELVVQLGGLMQYTSLIFATPVLFLLGLPILVNAWEQLRRGVVATDGLVILGVAAAFAASYVATMTGRGDVYFETGCAILVFLTLGRWLEARGRLRASERIGALAGLLPDVVEIERSGVRMTISPAAVEPGDLVIVPAGGRIPADGRIESGRGHIDEQIVTGESTPVTRDPGDEVKAGTLSLDGLLTIRATTTGSASTLARLIRLVETARRSRSRFERLSDRIATLFVPLTIVLAFIAGWMGVHRGGAMDGLLAGLAVMLIACPCALGLATPLAIWVALGRAAERHILFRDAEALEKLARVRAVCFDKTGTLTTGSPSVREFRLLAPGPFSASEVIRFAAGLAGGSTHALSRAISAYAAGAQAGTASPERSRTIGGRGVVGTVEGHEVAVGNAALMRDELTRGMDADVPGDNSVAFAAIDGRLCGVFVFDESLKSDARAAVSELALHRMHVAVLTGDHRRRGDRLSEELGVEVRSELTPEMKLACIEQVRAEHGAVAMVGDGLNDAPALAAADVGLAMGCGADLSRESAGVCLLGDDPSSLPWVVDLAQRTVRTIKGNLFWAFSYNLVGIGLAMAGRLSPVFAAGAMVGSSLLVVGNSLRLASPRGSAA